MSRRWGEIELSRKPLKVRRGIRLESGGERRSRLWLWVLLGVGAAALGLWLVLRKPSEPDVSSFDLAIPVILAHEGTDTNFWVDDPNDRGGETAWGISTLIIQREGITAAELGLANLAPGALKNLTKAAAAYMYKKLFWDKYGYGRLWDQRVATKVFDASVNMGPSTAHRLAQKAAGVCGNPPQDGVDGIFGKHTVDAINACDPNQFLSAYVDQMHQRYDAIIAADPTQQKFASNWSRRADWVG